MLRYEADPTDPIPIIKRREKDRLKVRRQRACLAVQCLPGGVVSCDDSSVAMIARGVAFWRGRDGRGEKRPMKGGTRTKSFVSNRFERVEKFSCFN